MHKTEAEIDTTVREMEKEIENETEILLLLTPPHIKPTNNFGFHQSEIDFVNNLVERKKVVLYHFGNPYALRLFKTEKTVATVIVYQDFKEFQEVATAHFLGKLEAQGTLPVHLDKIAVI